MISGILRDRRTADVLAVTAAAIIAILFFLGRWQGVIPFAFQGSDAGNISSFAAARSLPHLFAHDALLGDPSTTAFYVNVHTVAVSWLGQLTGDFGLGLLLLLIPTVFLHLAGYYVLGRTLFGGVLGAVLLTLVMAVTLPLPFGEYWGLYKDALPRTLFSALLPFVLALVIRWRERPRLWVVPMALFGLLTYVHPVSAPPVAAAVWLGLVALSLRELGARRIVDLALAAGAFLIVMAPFAVLYFSAGAAAPNPEAAEQAHAILARRYAPGFLDVGEALMLFAKSWAGPAALLPIAAIAGAGYLWAKAPQARRPLLFFAAMFAGLVLLAFGVAAVEQALAATGYKPRLIDFLRASRYLPMLMILVAVWALTAWASGRRGGAAILAAACVLAPAGWALALDSVVVQPPRALAGCALRGKLLCGPTDNQQDRLDVLAYLRDRASAGESVVSLADGDLGLDVRYVARRPLAFSVKDGGSLGYASPEALIRWDEHWRRFTPLVEKPTWPAAASFSTQVGATYLILDAEDAGDAPAAAVCLRNASYVLAKAAGPCPAPA